MLDSQKLAEFTWRGPKVKEGLKLVQTEKRLIDMKNDELSKCYEHCKLMLFNNDKKNLGRFLVLDEIKEQITKCGVELAIRWFEKFNCEPKYTRFKLMGEVRSFISNNPHLDKSTIKLSDVYNGVPTDYANISTNDIIDGCLDNLGKLNQQHLTLKFILKQGLWLTSQESTDLYELTQEGDVRDRIEVIKERLGLREDNIVYMNASGLNYTQLRAMVLLKSKLNRKYSELTTDQLETLRYKVLFALEKEVNFHISQWKKKMDEIEQVAEFNKYIL